MECPEFQLFNSKEKRCDLPENVPECEKTVIADIKGSTVSPKTETDIEFLQGGSPSLSD